jgi:hypothetical protein
MAGWQFRWVGYSGGRHLLQLEMLLHRQREWCVARVSLSLNLTELAPAQGHNANPKRTIRDSLPPQAASSMERRSYVVYKSWTTRFVSPSRTRPNWGAACKGEGV